MRMKKMLKCIIISVVMLFAILVIYTVSAKKLISCFVVDDKMSMATFIYNHQVYRGLWDKDCKKIFTDNILQVSSEFMSDDDLTEDNFDEEYEEKYKDAIGKLELLEKVKATDVSEQASETIKIISREYNGRIELNKAEVEYRNNNFVECLKLVSLIDQDYSLYESVNLLYEDTVSEILYSVSNPNSIKEYEEYISKLDTCIDITNEKQFIVRKEELEKEQIVFKKVVEFIDKADEYVNRGDFINALKVLNEPARKYPNEKHLALALEDCQSFLIFYVGEEVNKLVENGEYKEAISLIEEAQQVYDCDDLTWLKDQVVTVSNPLYRFKNGVSEKTKSIISYFKNDVENVKKEGGVTYVFRSGEKILLGDYSEKNVSLLSVAGSGLLSIIGLDAPLDVRDFMYDVQHIGEEDDCVVQIALDTVAIIPVIGVLKYLKYAKKTGKMADVAGDVAKVADDINDATKEANIADDIGDATDEVHDVAKGVDAVSDVAKATDSIDVVKETKLGKVADAEKEIKHVEHIDTINQNLAGKTHPKTGVEFNRKKIELKNGKTYEGVFPQFDYSYECKLPDDLLMDTDTKQFKKCNEQLKNAIKNDDSLRKKFNKRQLEQIANGDKPSGFTWHHNEQEGVMQLVETKVHDATNHTGGRKIWGGGTGAR